MVGLATTTTDVAKPGRLSAGWPGGVAAISGLRSETPMTVGSSALIPVLLRSTLVSTRAQKTPSIRPQTVVVWRDV